MIGPSELADVKVSTQHGAIERVVVNGQDVTKSVQSMSIYSEPFRPVEVTLTVPSDFSLEGKGVVVLESAGGSEAFLEWIRGLDAATVEGLALQKMSWGSSSLTQNILSVLEEMIRESL